MIINPLFTTRRMSRTETHRFLFRAGLGIIAEEDIMTDMYVMLVDDEDKSKSSRRGNGGLVF